MSKKHLTDQRFTEFTLDDSWQQGLRDAGADILIATPGRLIDFFKQGLYDLKHAQVAALDEAERMFDLGFIRDIRFLLRRMPPGGQPPEPAVFGDPVVQGHGTGL